MSDLFPEDGFDDDDGDLESSIDPELLAKLDKEVEDFARRLNANWRSPVPEAAAAAPSAAPRQQPAAVVASVQSLLNTLLSSMSLSSHLQVRL